MSNLKSISKEECGHFAIVRWPPACTLAASCTCSSGKTFCASSLGESVYLLQIFSPVLNLEDGELDRVEKTVEKIKQMTWDQVYKTSSKSQKRGLNWEPIEGQQTAKGRPIASIRISKKFRVRVCRDGKFMRFISLHPDHDGAYDESGGEDL